MPFNIEKARQIHGDKYDYSKVIYVNAKSKIEIICPIHGLFLQTPNNHYSQGCSKCGRDNASKFFRKTTEEFIEKAKKVHGTLYNYNKVSYQSCFIKVEIVCPTHGSFWQSPNHHLFGIKCPKCGIEKRTNKRKHTTEMFIEKAKKVHGTLYNYSKVIYKNSNTKISIACNKHGLFKQTPSGHLSGKGCEKCCSSISKSGTLWLSSFKIPEMLREHKFVLEGKTYFVDGYNPSTNTIYEYFGVFWHGHPDYTDHTKVNPRTKIPFKVLYNKTLDRIELFKRHNFNMVYEWGTK